MADPFDEVEESYRQQRLAEFARKYWPFGAGLVVAAILGIIGYDLYRAWGRDRATDVALDLKAAQELANKGDFDAAAASFDALADKAPRGYRTIAELDQAASLMRAGRTKEAIAALDAAAKSAPDPVVRDAARVQAALAAADEESLAQVESRLKPIIDGEGPWAFQARELIAMEAMSEGDAARARREFQYLSLALEAPQGVRQRATAALVYLGPESPAKPTTPAAPAAPASPAAAPAPGATP